VLLPLGALIAYFLLLVLATHLPPKDLRPFDFALRFKLSDKLAHATAYGGLTLLAVAVWRIGRPVSLSARGKSWGLFGVCCLIACWGLLDEFTQPYFGRNFDWIDWLADLTGMSLAVTLSALLPSGARTRWLTAFSLH
jgi:VanZ family protein